MSSDTGRPSRAPSTTKSVIRAMASGWLSLTPRSRRFRATMAAMAMRSLSFSRGVRFIGRFLEMPQARQGAGAGQFDESWNQKFAYGQPGSGHGPDDQALARGAGGDEAVTLLKPSDALKLALGHIGAGRHVENTGKRAVAAQQGQAI